MVAAVTLGAWKSMLAVGDARPASGQVPRCGCGGRAGQKDGDDHESATRARHAPETGEHRTLPTTRWRRWQSGTR